MDCQKLIVYGILLLVGIYILKDVCGFKIPLIEGMENALNSNGPGAFANVNALPGGAGNAARGEFRFAVAHECLCRQRAGKLVVEEGVTA